MLVEDLLQALSPKGYARAQGFEPDEWQTEVLASTAKRIIICCARQVGKSFITGHAAYRTAEYENETLSVMLAPAFRQSLNLFQSVKKAARRANGQVVRETLTELHLANRSQVIALPGKDETVRSYSSVRLLILDEAAYVRDLVFYGVRPFVAVSGGTIILLSTPAGREGFFWDAWNSPGWERYRVTAYDCPRIPREEIEEAQTTMPEWAFKREYMAEFTDADEQLIASDFVREAHGQVIPLRRGSDTVGASVEPLRLVHG